MASAGHMLIQESRTVETKIKTLINNDLRTICRAYGQVVSGTKAALQARCIGILRDIVAKGDVTRFHDFDGRVNNHGNPASTAPAATRPSYAPSMPITSLPPPRPQYSSAVRLDFKSSPFYERLEFVLRPQDLPEMPQNRHTVKSSLVLTDDQARRLTSDTEQYRLMVYCAQPNAYSACDIAFPPQIEIKVNDDEVKANFKGLKNKLGSTKPADITSMVRLKAGYPNRLSVCYALTQKRYLYTVYLVRYVNTAALVDKIRANRVFPKHKVLEEMQRLNNDPDIAATAYKMSLKDPISTSRITVPIRSTVCSHNQCFDASFFLQLQEQAPTWQCPLCNKTVSFESLSVDKYFEEILHTTQRSIEQVTIEPSGEWRVIKDDEDKSSSNTVPRAAYDRDFDDEDVVELDAASKAAIKKESSQAALNVFNTPPLSSREPSVAQSHTQASNKRTSTVIDLTLSDDEDEPIRPTKRTRHDEQAFRPHPHMQTPTSLSDNSHVTSHLPQDLLHPSLSVNAANPHASNLIGPLNPPISGPSFSSHGPSAFHASSDMNARCASSHMPAPTSGVSNWPTFGSPSLPFGDASDLSRRISASRSPSQSTMTNWQTHFNNTNHRSTSLSDDQQPHLPGYTGFAQDQSTILSASNNFPPNGWSGDSASPG